MLQLPSPLYEFTSNPLLVDKDRPITGVKSLLSFIDYLAANLFMFLKLKVLNL